MKAKEKMSTPKISAGPIRRANRARGAADTIRTMSAKTSPATEAYRDIIKALRGLPCFASG